MAITARTRLVNPRLGTYFGIFFASIAALVLMALMLEQLGLSDGVIRLVMFAGPIACYIGIGVMASTRETDDYFVSGRRVPAFFNGLTLSISALGGAGFLALTGTYFSIGFDALCLGLGIVAGLLFMGILLAPFLRKFGAYTLPSYLGRRFASPMLRVTAAAVMAVPLLLLLAAEARFAAYASAWLTGMPESLMALVVLACTAAMVAGGGARSLTWSSAAKAIVAIFALAVCATIIAVMMSNLPLPQMTHGNVLRMLSRTEDQRGVPTFIAPLLGLEFPGDGREPLAKRFLQSFGSVGTLAFVLMSLMAGAGIAASPSLLARINPAPGIYDARKSVGWAVLITGILLLTLPAMAVFLRALLLEQVVGQPVDRLPAWFQSLQEAGIARIAGSAPTVSFSSVTFERDAALFALPLAAGFPQALVHLALAGALAAAMTGLAAAMTAAATIFSEDVVYGLRPEAPPDAARINTARIGLGAAAIVTVWLATVGSADPFRLFLWSLCFSASAIFPVLVLSIWWKRLNAWGAAAGMLAGAFTAAFAILLGETGAWALPGVLAGAVGLPAGVLAAMAVTRITPAPRADVLERVFEMRVPGGETLYDREVRLQRLKARPLQGP
jgi:cation/acetate symporter